jgi:hypothetical protein
MPHARPTHPKAPASPHTTRVRLLPFLFGVVLVVADQYWVSSTWNGFTLTSLFINAVFITFALTALNSLLRRAHGHLALRPAELLLVYMMLAVATGAAGHDTIEMLTQVLGYTSQFATAENDWRSLFFRYLPSWLLVEDPLVTEGLYRNGATFFEPRVLRAWTRPLMYWTLFLGVLYFGMMCANVILRKQWMERERLAFPVAQIPLGLIQPRGSSHGRRLFWTGFIGAAFLSVMNGLHRLVPSVPGPTYGKFDLGALFTEHPWNGIDVVYVEFLPFVMGIAFFIPLTLSFSIWFFYWFWKWVNVLGRATGLHLLPGFPGYWTQGMGGVVLMAGMFLFWARRHLADVVRRALHRSSPHDATDDSPYRFAVWGLVASALFFLAFLRAAGMAVWVGVLFLAGFSATSIVTTRLRAQLGPPTHEIPFTTSGLIKNLVGLRHLDAGSLTQFAVFRFVDFGQRGSPMPQMMESLYLRGRLHAGQPAVFLAAMALASVLGTAVGFVGNLQRSYRDTVQTWVGDWAFPELAGHLQYRTTGTNLVYVVYLLIGAAVVLFLGLMGRSFIWWPFHPLGYIMGNEWMLRHLWFPIFLAWAIRWTLLRIGGLTAHRRALPFFAGVTVGDATCLALWSIYGTVFREWTLTFVYW